MPPWDLPAGNTQSGMMSRSTPGGGPDNFNAVRFENAIGQEVMWLHAERDLNVDVKNNMWVDVGNDQTVVIEGKRDVTVGKGDKLTITEGGRDVTITAGGDKLTVGADGQIVNITGDVTETITGNVTETTTGSVNKTITGDVTETTTGAVNKTITGDVTETTTGTVNKTTTGDVTEHITGNVNITATGKYNLDYKDDWLDHVPNKVSITDLFNVSITGLTNVAYATTDISTKLAGITASVVDAEVGVLKFQRYVYESSYAPFGDNKKALKIDNSIAHLEKLAFKICNSELRFYL
jgi:type VI secretion system secreted protein VgrG